MSGARFGILLESMCCLCAELVGVLTEKLVVTLQGLIHDEKIQKMALV